MKHLIIKTFKHCTAKPKQNIFNPRETVSQFKDSMYNQNKAVYCLPFMCQMFSLRLNTLSSVNSKGIE